MSEVNNLRKLVGLLSNDGFVDAISNAEELLNDAEETLERVERIENDANDALREANQALDQVDDRLRKFDETVSLLEAKIEAGFSVGFFFFALNSYLAGNLFLAAGLGFMGLLGASSLIVTIVTLPQVQRLLSIGDYATDQVEETVRRGRGR